MAKERPEYYILIPPKVRYDSNISMSAKVLYGEIVVLANKNGFCFASNTHLAKLFSTSNRSITRWLMELEKNGYLTREVELNDKKEVVSRRLYPIDKIDYTPIDKNDMGSRQNGPYPHDKSVTPPIDKYGAGNNTSINNTSINNNVPFEEIVTYLNDKAKRNYKHSTNKTRSLIKARTEEGFSLDDFKKVIDNKVNEWENTDMSNYLRPETLFGNKFESYLNQKPTNKDNYDNDVVDRYPDLPF